MSKAELFKALSEAQAEYGAVDRTATNPHFGSKYAPLDKVLDAITPALNSHGLCRGWRQSMEGDAVTVTAFIGHGDTGEEVTSSLTWGVPDNIQHLGAALTYMRRYTMEALAGVAADSDDDGNAATQTAPKPRAKVTMDTAMAKGAANKAAEEPRLSDALVSLGWSIDELRDRLVNTKRVSDRAKVEMHPSKWPKWAIKEAWACVDEAKSGTTGPDVSGVPAEEIPF